MNILMFNYEYPPVGGGGGVAHEVIAEELAKRHRVVVITSGTRDLPTREERGGVDIRRVPVLGRNSRTVASLGSMLTYPPPTWWAAARLLGRERFDVVNAHFAIPTGAASLPVARLARIPHVLSIHGGDIYDPSKRLSPHRSAVLRRAVRTVLNGSDEVVAQSENTRANARTYYQFHGPIRIIPLGIRLPTRAPASREELGLPTDAFLLITVGRLIARKALDRLLHAMKRLAGRPVHLIVVGAGPAMESLQNLAAQLHVEDAVHFTGWVSEQTKWELLSASDAYVSTSLHEGFGLVFLEAMAMGLPVIAPDHGGQVDFLRNGETGYVTPAGDDDAVTRAILDLLQAPEASRAMGRANLARVERYRAERCGQDYEELFDRVAYTRGR